MENGNREGDSFCRRDVLLSLYFPVVLDTGLSRTRSDGPVAVGNILVDDWAWRNSRSTVGTWEASLHNAYDSDFVCFPVVEKVAETGLGMTTFRAQKND